MLRKRLLFWIGSFLFCFLGLVSIGYCSGYKAAAVIRSDKKVIFDYNGQKALPPASTIKVATALYILKTRKNRLNEWVYVTKRAAQAEPSKAYLKAGDRYKARDLLYAMLIASSNDAASALAEWHSKTEYSFCRNLTAFLKKQGIYHTEVKTASGLPQEGQKTTTRDLCLIMLEAIKEKDIIKALGKKTFIFYSKSGRRHRGVNHNKLLWNKKYQGLIGKTGFTRKARQCFLGAVLPKDTGDKAYAFAMLGGRTLWDNIKELAGMAYEDRD